MVAATSGNTGASVAMISAMKGYHYIGMLHGALQCSQLVQWCYLRFSQHLLRCLHNLSTCFHDFAMIVTTNLYVYEDVVCVCWPKALLALGLIPQFTLCCLQ